MGFPSGEDHSSLQLREDNSNYRISRKLPSSTDPRPATTDLRFSDGQEIDHQSSQLLMGDTTIIRSPNVSVQRKRNSRPRRINLPSFEKKSRQSHKLKQIISDYWILEIAAWFLALLVLASLIGVLRAFDGSAIPKWRFDITLGALASLLATIVGFLLAIPLASAVGQWKWLWCRSLNPVSDFAIIERASHGPAGSLSLIFRWRGGIIAVIGSLLTILQLAIGPFIQQIIQHKTITVNATEAAIIPVAVAYQTSYSLAGTSNPTLPMEAAIMNAALDPTAGTNTFDIIPTCPTGNCTWPFYQSLAICSSCDDLSGRLQSFFNATDLSTTWVLPNNLSLEVPHQNVALGMVTMTMNIASYPIMPTDSLPLPSVSFPLYNSSNALLDVMIIIGHANYTSDITTGPFAAECMLQVCYETYSASETNTNFQENIINDPVYILQGDRDMGDIWFENNGFTMTLYDAQSISGYLQSMFQDHVQQEDGLGPTTTFEHPITQSMFEALNNTAPHTLDNVMSNIAKSMTRAIRTNINWNSTSGLIVSGQAFAEQVLVVIVWAWISLPICLVFFVLLFLIVIITYTKMRSVPNWKDNVLTTLLYGIDDEGRQAFEGLGDNDDIEDRAEKLIVRLENDGDGWRLKHA